jgi:catalase
MSAFSTPAGAKVAAPLGRAALWARLALIGLILATVTAAFAYVGGWLSPGRLTPARFIDEFQRVNGVYPGFRRNHAKGLCLEGVFESNGRGARLSRASIFAPGRIGVVGRFALAGGQPYIADAPTITRSMAIRFVTPDGEEWRTGVNDLPVFPAATPQALYDLLGASAPDPVTEKPDPAKMKDFLARYPETAQALAMIQAQPVASGFANATYNSLDAFRFIDQAGHATPVRWSMVPVQPFAAAQLDADHADKNYLFDALMNDLRLQPLQWHLIVTIGLPQDPTDDATIAWPPGRETVDVGILTVERLVGEAAGICRTINFDPLVLPDGIAPSDDPLLSARSAVYARSFFLRAGEIKEPSAVTTPPNGIAAP